ncbi:3-deoxy-D-manno-octulosonate 8-phosphate phosphatase [Actinobacteria bacterium IMCC26103]|nr:3-deoxy-D-manno-octulosonate 8-phosphate phosphatase [Actinobacteria bacterium IMCC26103]
MKKLNLFKARADFSKISLVISDFDGVMTDGKVEISEQGFESVTCSRLDGIGVKLLKKNGIDVIILSSEANNSVKHRAKKLNITAYTNVLDKLEFVTNLQTKKRISSDEIFYIGDEINDLAIMKILTYTACPKDANSEIKKVAKYLLNSKGGNGVIREVSDLICLDKKWQ